MEFFVGLAIIGTLSALYVVAGYPVLLAATVRLTRILGGRLDPVAWEPPEDHELPGVTIAIPAFNEEDLIAARITNLLDTDYPREKLEVLIVSDGSSDNTVSEVQRIIGAHPSFRIRIEEFADNRGKSAVQNCITEMAGYDVIVFTDCETRFCPHTLRALVAPMKDPTVGVCGGVTQYIDKAEDNAFSKLYQAYRCLENTTRRLETQLGVGCKIDGPCAAGLRGSWRALLPHEAEDQVLPLMARQNGKKTVHVEQAFSYDVANSHAKQDFVQRRRMTRKALLSFKSSWGWSHFSTHPWFTAAYVSHKLLRFFLPVFLALSLLSLIGVAAELNAVWLALSVVFGTLVLSSFGARLPKLGRIFGLPYAFLIGNLAFLMGIWDAALGRSQGAYVATRKVGRSKPR